MAAPVVLVGLTTISAVNSTTGIEQLITAGGGTNSAAVDAEVFIQGTASVARRATASISGLQFDNGTGIDLSNGRHIFMWSANSAGGGTATLTNGGLRFYLGDGGSPTPTNYSAYYVDGDDLNLTVGGWRCYVVSPLATPRLTGTAAIPSNNVVSIGLAANQLSTVANLRNFYIDAIRVGTGFTIYAGEETNAGGIATVTAVNESDAFGAFNRTPIGAEFQCKLDIGLDNTTTATYFKVDNRVLLAMNKNPLAEEATPYYNTTLGFTGISVRGGITTAIFNNVGFFSADTYDKGYFTCSGVTNEPANVAINGCTFRAWGPTTLSSNTTATNSIWINSEPVTLNAGIVEQSTFETGVGGTYVFAGSTPDNISNCSFIGGGTGGGHGLEVTSSGSYDFVNNTFSNFGATDTDDAAIHINGAGVNVVFNISGNDATAEPTYKLTGAGATVSFNAAVTVNVTGLPVTPDPEDATEIRVLVAGQDLFVTSAGIGTTNPDDAVGIESSRTSTFSFNMKKDFDFDLRIINLDYVPQFISSIRAANDPTNVSSNMKLDRVSQNDNQ